jgi:hypothetical protein
MRKLLAVLLAGLFLILFLVAVTVNQVVDTASDPDVITGMLDDAEAYDYAYDNIIGNLVHDLMSKGIEFNTGLEGDKAQAILTFEDTDAAALAITELIETLVPREYVKEKLEESLTSVIPYAQGEVDEFTIDLEAQERVRTVPGAARKVVADLGLTERIIEDLLLPQFDSFAADFSGQGLGIDFTSEEIETNARLIFEPEWLEGEVFGAIDEITPYFAGDSDSFNVVIHFDDRVEVIGQILKDKLIKQDTLYNLVFAQVVDPLIQQTVAQSTTVGFGIELTEQEVVDTFEVIAPRAWVKQQGEGVIDALIAYMVGSANSLEYTLDLSDRKVTAASELQSLAVAKLRSTLGDIEACSTPIDLLGASQDIAAQQLPRCIAGGQATIDLAVTSFSPILNSQVSMLVENQVPNEISYTQADLESQIGGSFDSVDDIRQQITDGVSFSDQDLIELMASDGSASSRREAEDTLKIFADGLVITERNITDQINPAAQDQFDSIRDYAGTALSVRWILWIVVLIPLALIALIGGRGWPGRLKWAGGVALVCAIVAYGGITVVWGMNDIALDYVPEYGTNVSNEFMADYPRLGAELESGELNVRFERALDSWQQGWKNQTIPWMIAGLLAFAVGYVLSMKRPKQKISMGGTAYKGSSPSAAAGGFEIPKDWGDAPEGEDDSAADAKADDVSSKPSDAPSG